MQAYGQYAVAQQTPIYFSYPQTTYAQQPRAVQSVAPTPAATPAATTAPVATATPAATTPAATPPAAVTTTPAATPAVTATPAASTSGSSSSSTSGGTATGTYPRCTSSMYVGATIKNPVYENKEELVTYSPNRTCCAKDSFDDMKNWWEQKIVRRKESRADRYHRRLLESIKYTQYL